MERGILQTILQFHLILRSKNCKTQNSLSLIAPVFPFSTFQFLHSSVRPWPRPSTLEPDFLFDCTWIFILFIFHMIFSPILQDIFIEIDVLFSNFFNIKSKCGDCLSFDLRVLYIKLILLFTKCVNLMGIGRQIWFN